MSKQSVREAESKRAKRVLVATGNPVFFGEVYMRPYDENWSAPLPQASREMLGFISAVRRGVLMSPPEFLKTTVCSQLYPLWLIYRAAALDRIAEVSIMLLSEEEELAKRNLSVSAWHIENNERLREDFTDTLGRPLVEPDPGEDKWAEDALIVRRPGVSKDPTIQAKGINSQGIQGARLRTLIGDDVVTPRSAESPAIQRKAKRLWDTQVTTRVLEDGQALIVGNFNHRKDLLSTLAEKPAYAVLRRPSLYLPGRPDTAPKNVRDPEAIERLPERWPRARLIQEASEKPHTFSTIHFLRSSEEGGGALKTEWVTRIDPEQIPAIGRVVLFALDPAPGAEVDPDPSFFTITVGILTNGRHLDVVASYADRSETTEQVAKLAEMWAAWVARTVDDPDNAAYDDELQMGGIALSGVALDKYFKGAVLVGHPELRPYLHPHSLGAASKLDRLSALGSYFRSGWARVTERAWNETTAEADDADQEESLAEQWESFPFSNHDDRLDGVDVLVREALARGAGAQQPAYGVQENGRKVRPSERHGLTGDLLGKVM